MVTAAMIAMFYLGTASGVVGAVLLGATRSRDHAAGRPLEHASPSPSTSPEAGALRSAA